MRKILSCTVVILCMVIIFRLPSQPANQSNKLSTEITKFYIKVIKKVYPNIKLNIEQFHHLVTKNAHFLLHFVLGILMINALERINVAKYKSLTLLIIDLYAISDEVHQIFVPGKSPEVMGVLIDSRGACVGILVYLVLGRIKKQGYWLKGSLLCKG